MTEVLLTLVIIAFFGTIAVILFLTRHPDSPKSELQKVNGGWVIYRAREKNHSCDPPSGWGTNPQVRHLQDTKDLWTAGDQWLCGCGRAWVVTTLYPSGESKLWRRSEKDDVSVIES